MNKPICKTHSKSRGKIRKQRQPFPYIRAAKLWAEGKTIANIAQRLGRIDVNNPNDPYHSLRNFLRRMHAGYPDANGRIVRLPYRVSPTTVTLSRKVGLQGA
jgi:hypothetical protein